MSSITLSPNASGTAIFTVAAPGTSTNQTLTLPEATGEIIANPSLVGMVATFAMNTPPSGWIKANGAAVSRTTYAALFAAIGTTFGVGDGSTTFNVPDLRGEFARGWDDGRGVDTGRVFGSAQADAFLAHSHTFTGYGSTGSVLPNITMNGNLSSVGGTSGLGAPIANTGGTETRPRNIALLACIKY